MLGVKLPRDVLYSRYNYLRTRQSVLLQTLLISTSASLVLERINPRTSKQKASQRSQYWGKHYISIFPRPLPLGSLYFLFNVWHLLILRTWKEHVWLTVFWLEIHSLFKSFILSVFIVQNIFWKHEAFKIVMTTIIRFTSYELYPMLMILSKMASGMKIFTFLRYYSVF